MNCCGVALLYFPSSVEQKIFGEQFVKILRIFLLGLASSYLVFLTSFSSIRSARIEHGSDGVGRQPNFWQKGTDWKLWEKQSKSSSKNQSLLLENFHDKILDNSFHCWPTMRIQSNGGQYVPKRATKRQCHGSYDQMSLGFSWGRWHEYQRTNACNLGLSMRKLRTDHYSVWFHIQIESYAVNTAVFNEHLYAKQQYTRLFSKWALRTFSDIKWGKKMLLTISQCRQPKYLTFWPHSHCIRLIK